MTDSNTYLQDGGHLENVKEETISNTERYVTASTRGPAAMDEKLEGHAQHSTESAEKDQ